MINRAALMLRYKTPAVEWINDADPSSKNPLTLDRVNDERTVYLISDEDADTPYSLDRWIKRNYKQVFENELDSWYTDPSLWPKIRDLKTFREWFDVECHTVLIDTAEGPIYDDEV